MKRFFSIVLLCIIASGAVFPSFAAAPRKLEKPALNERWFGIYVDNERVGFYRQKLSETADGYRFEGDGSVRMRVMRTKECASKE